MLAAGVAVGSPPAAAQQAAPPPTEAIDDIVITARPGTPAPLPDAVDYWRRQCFEPMRTARRFAPPEDDGDWAPLDAASRRKFGIADPAVPAYGLADPERGHSLIVKFERIAQPGRLTERRCTMVVVGGRDHARLVPAVSAVFRAVGTRRHVGEDVGTPALPGWEQWLWTGMPPRGSDAWRGVEPKGAGRGGGTFIVVTDRELFYRRNDYIFADLKLRETPDRPLAMLSFSHTTAEGVADRR